CSGDFTLYRMDDTTGETVTYITGVRNAHMLYVDEGPTVWVADFQSDTLWRIRREDGRVAIREGLAKPWGIAASMHDDSFYITEWESDNLINITRDGEVTLIASDFVDPSGLVVTETEIYVANNANARRAVEWMEIDEDGQIGEPQPLVTGLQNVTNLTLGPDGNLYIAFALGTRGVVGRVDPETCKEASCTNAQVELVVWTELAAPLAG